MTTAIDSNVIVALWAMDPTVASAAQVALDVILEEGSLVIAAPVFAELLAAPSRNPALLDSFCAESGIRVDWDLAEAVWRAAGVAYSAYASRRRRHGNDGPRRILTDFVIGAHANENGYRLLTLDERLYRAAFPSLRILRV